MKFGTVFKTARKSAKKTLREAAERVGLSIGNISDIEHSRRRPPKKEVLSKLELLYDAPKNYLINAAKEEWKIPDEAISIYSRRPELTMSLLRYADQQNDAALKDLIEKFGKGRRKR